MESAVEKILNALVGLLQLFGIFSRLCNHVAVGDMQQGKHFDHLFGPATLVVNVVIAMTAGVLDALKAAHGCFAMVDAWRISN